MLQEEYSLERSARIRLVEERKRRQWSQLEVADFIGTTQRNVSRWELGLTTPGSYFRTKLCELFGKNAQELGLLDKPRGGEQPPPHSRLDAPSAPSPELAQPFPLWYVPYDSNPFFTGREDILHQVVMDLCTEPTRVRAITGLPGVGKTSLAIALAHHPHIQERFCDGVLWVGLGPIPQLAEALNSWATLLGITPTEAQTLATPDALARWLHQRLRNRQMLLILDDAWNLSDTMPFQVGGTQCVHLLTTRSPLLAYTVAHEHVTELAPLSEAASMQLLQQLAPLAAKHYPRELQALVQPSGGLPLALTLLGRLVHVQSLHGSPRRLVHTLQQLHHNIQARFQVAEPVSIDNAMPSFPVGTEMSLRTTIDVTVQQLAPAAQCALHALAVFAPAPQSFSEEVALAICGTEASIFDTLVDNGLVELCQEQRYQIHQTIFDYTRLQELDPEVEKRFIAFIIPFVERHTHDLQVLNQDLYLITTALELAFAKQSYSLALRGILALQPLIEQRRLYSLAPTLWHWGQQAALFLHDREGLARLWLFRGKMAELCGEVMQAQQAYLEGLVLARELYHQELLPELLVLAGGTLIDTEGSSQAERYLLEGLNTIEQVDDGTPRSRVFQYLGELADNLGKNAEALSFYTRGLAMARQAHDWQTVGALLQDVGAQAVRGGDFAQAVIAYEEGLTYARQLGDLQRQSALLMNLGILAWYEQRPEEAIELSQESLKLAREIDHQMRISSVLQNLGMMMRCQDQPTLAEQYLQESLELAQRIGHRWLIGETSAEIGFLALKQKQTARAKQIFEEVQQHAQAIQAPQLFAQALFGLAQVAEQQGQRSEALGIAQESLVLCTQLSHQILIQEIEAWRTALSEECIM